MSQIGNNIWHMHNSKRRIITQSDKQQIWVASGHDLLISSSISSYYPPVLPSFWFGLGGYSNLQLGSLHNQPFFLTPVLRTAPEVTADCSLWWWHSPLLLQTHPFTTNTPVLHLPLFSTVPALPFSPSCLKYPHHCPFMPLFFALTFAAAPIPPSYLHPNPHHCSLTHILSLFLPHFLHGPSSLTTAPTPVYALSVTAWIACLSSCCHCTNAYLCALHYCHDVPFPFQPLMSKLTFASSRVELPSPATCFEVILLPEVELPQVPYPLLISIMQFMYEKKKKIPSSISCYSWMIGILVALQMSCHF